jgi:hypothetical protein
MCNRITQDCGVIKKSTGVHILTCRHSRKLKHLHMHTQMSIKISMTTMSIIHIRYTRCINPCIVGMLLLQQCQSILTCLRIWDCFVIEFAVLSLAQRALLIWRILWRIILAALLSFLYVWWNRFRCYCECLRNWTWIFVRSVYFIAAVYKRMLDERNQKHIFPANKHFAVFVTNLF